MREIQSHMSVLAALALSMVGAASAPRAEGGEREPSTDGEFAGFLVPEEELAAVSLSIVDDKLAMSLAVETRVQIDLAEMALASVHDESLTALTESKLRGYCRLYNTMDYLTGGRAGSMLARASRQFDRDADDTKAEVRAAPETTRTSRVRTKKRTRRGGLGGILRNTTTKAILVVRLEIAEQYAAQLRAELELSPPDEFDCCYLDSEIYGQMQWLAMLRVFEQHASRDLSRIVHLATLASESHVLAAKQIVERLDNSLPPRGTTDRTASAGNGSGT